MELNQIKKLRMELEVDMTSKINRFMEITGASVTDLQLKEAQAQPPRSMTISGRKPAKRFVIIRLTF